MVAGPVTVRVRTASTKLMVNAPLCSLAVPLRITAPPPAAVVGPATAGLAEGSAAVRVTVRVCAGAPLVSEALTGRGMLMVPLVSPAPICKLPAAPPTSAMV